MNKAFVAAGLLTLTFLSACQGGSSSTPPGNDFGLTEPHGTFIDQNGITPNDPSVFSEGCQKPGLPNSDTQIDKRLKIGTAFEDQLLVANSKGQKSKVIYTVTVTGLNAPLSYDAEWKVESSEVEGLNPGTSMNQHCEVADQSGVKTFSCSFDKPLPQILTPDCFVASAGQEKWTAGFFKLGQGSRTVGAYQIEMSTKGPLVCNGRQAGQGQSRIVFVKSNEIPATQGNPLDETANGANFCGGVFLKAFWETSLLREGKTSEIKSSLSWEILNVW